MNETPGSRLRRARKAIHLTVEAFAGKIGVSKGAVSLWENDKSVPAKTALSLMAKLLHLNSEWLLTGEGDMFLTPPVESALLVKTIKVLGRVPAGFPGNISEEDVIEVISLPNAPEGAYALIVHGESMGPEIRPGDYALFVPADRADVRPGDVVIANNEFGEPMIKRYVLKDGEPFLKSDNPAYPSFRPNDHYKIVGKVIRVWREIRI